MVKTKKTRVMANNQWGRSSALRFIVRWISLKRTTNLKSNCLCFEPVKLTKQWSDMTTSHEGLDWVY